jgi:hypothetical protein
MGMGLDSGPVTGEHSTTKSKLGTQCFPRRRTSVAGIGDQSKGQFGLPSSASPDNGLCPQGLTGVQDVALALNPSWRWHAPCMRKLGASRCDHPSFSHRKHLHSCGIPNSTQKFSSDQYMVMRCLQAVVAQYLADIPSQLLVLSLSSLFLLDAELCRSMPG